MTDPFDPALLRLVDQCLLVGFHGREPDAALLERLSTGLGGVILFGHNVGDRDELTALVSALRDAGGETLLVAVDEEGGEVTRLEHASGSAYPTAWALGAADDPALTERVAAVVAADLAAVGVNLDLAPVADVNSDPDNPVIGLRSFGQDPELVARHVAAFVNGLQSAGVGACAKHFPGHGATRLDSHLDLPVLDADLARIRKVDLVPFQAAIGAGVRSVMTAHVVFTALDQDPATISAPVLGLLRDELGFDGVVITDALTMAAIRERWGVAEGAVRSLMAGADLLCLDAAPEDQDATRRAILAAVAEGRLDVSRLESAAERVATLAAWARPRRAAASPDRERLGLAAARRAVHVDAGQGVLPLGPAPYVLEAASGRWSGVGITSSSLGSALAALVPDTTVHRLAGPEGPDDQVTAALAAADGRPLVLVVRDAHRHPWQRTVVEQVRAVRPGTIVVGTGTPYDAPLAPGHYVGALGSAPPCLTAAAEVLAGATGSEAS